MRVRSGAVDTYCAIGGPPAGRSWVVLIHDLGGSVDIWRYQVAALTDTYRVLTFDLRGQGAGSNPGGRLLGGGPRR